MRNARLQANDLGRAEVFFNTLLSKEDLKGDEREKEKEKVKEKDKENVLVEPKHPQINGGPLPFKIDTKPRFSDPPAPPPQQPLPEKPDVIRAHAFDPTSPLLKRTSTERPRSVPNVSSNTNGSPIKHESTSQIVSLVEALANAKKEIDAQNNRMRDLEDMLQKEREARETAEGRAKRLELESIGIKMNGFAKGGAEGNIVEEAFNPPAESFIEEVKSTSLGETSSSPDAVEASTAKLQENLELMMVEMREMKERMEEFRHRAITAEAERDTSRKTLAEMVEKIRTDELARRSTSTERARSSSTGKETADTTFSNGVINGKANTSPEKASLINSDAPDRGGDKVGVDNSLALALSQPPGDHDQLLYHSTPYASMLGVVLIGMGLMAYMNNWQKVER
jgi:hypothetical protein